MPWSQRSQSLDLLGLDPPFAEAEKIVEANTLGLIGETPFAEDAPGCGDRHETFEPAAELEKATAPAHSFKDCTPTQKALLIDVTDRAQIAVRRAAAFVGSAHGQPDRMKPATRQLLLRHFHTTRRDDLRHILTRYMRIAKAIEDGISFEGEKQCQARSTGRVCGYANMTQLFGGFGKVHICFDPRPSHCDFTSFPPDQQEAIVVHEVAHRYVGIDDKAYAHEAQYATLTPRQALDNADSYAIFAVEGSAVLKEGPDLEEDFSFEQSETSDLEDEGSYAAYGSEDESLSQVPASEDEAEFERCTADERFDEAEEYAEAPAWTASEEQLAFRSLVLAAHIRRKMNTKGKPLRDLRPEELATIPGTNVKTKTETAQAAGRLLAAARADLAKAKAAGDADALRTTSISVGSGYRDSVNQRSKWLRYFVGYYNRTRAARERMPDGPHSKAASDFMLRRKKDGGFGLAGRIAAPGFSNHQNGTAIDFIQDRSSQPVAIDSGEKNRERWRNTWFFRWLKQHAATHGFQGYSQEEWHWTYEPTKTGAREAEIQSEAASRTADTSPRMFLGGSIWTYQSRVCGADVAVYAPPSTSGRSKTDMMLYVHGLLGPCGAPKVMPEGLISAAPFRLGQLVVDSGRPMVLVVPRFQPGNDKTWNAHSLDRPEQLNALLAEVLGEIGQRLGRSSVQIDQLVIAGHSRAYAVLYPLARSHASPALATGALARLSKIWVLDATYGTPPMAAFDSFVTARPGVGVDVLYRATSPTDKFRGRSRGGAVALRPINARLASHCAVPGKLLPALLGELSTASASAAEEEQDRADLSRETLDWLDTEADAQQPDSLDWEDAGRRDKELETLESLIEAESGPGVLADRLKSVTALALGASLQQGSSGPAVEALQRTLTRLGHWPGATDGLFGAGTGQAVRAFQARSGLTMNGIVDDASKSALAAALAGRVTSQEIPGGDVDAAKEKIRLAAEGFGTDEAAILEALRSLAPPQLAELSADSTIISVLQDELSGDDLTAVGALLAKGRVGAMSRVDITVVTAEPSKYTIGTVAAAMARDILLEHRESLAATGTGTVQGNKCMSPMPAGAHSADCTTYVLDVLRSAFAAKGQASVWTKIKSTAARASGVNLLGTEVQKALQSEARWEGVFWAPDPRNPKDGSSEHPVAYRKVREAGLYYGVAVDRSKSVINYRPTDPAKPRNLSGIEKLRRLQFGVLAARGGKHMALIVSGSVYEIHWDKPATDPDAIEATPLERFVWESGAIVAPKGDLERAWNTP